MAIKKIEMRPEGTNDYVDILYPKTSADMVEETTDKKIMTSAERVKLAGIATSANNYVHPGSGTNPHATTKADIGLGSVLNYGIATVAEAKAGVSNVKYMTPQLTKEAMLMNDTTFNGIPFYGRSTNVLFSVPNVQTTTVSQSEEPYIIKALTDKYFGFGFLTIKGEVVGNYTGTSGYHISVQAYCLVKDDMRLLNSLSTKSRIFEERILNTTFNISTSGTYKEFSYNLPFLLPTNSIDIEVRASLSGGSANGTVSIRNIAILGSTDGTIPITLT